MRIGVVGCGVMGAGIAEICARAGLDTVVVEAGPDALRRGRQRLERSLERGFERGHVDAATRDRALANLRYTLDLGELSDRGLVIEAVVESIVEKAELLARLDEILSADAVIASNTSSIPIERLAMATKAPERVIGLHFFNPVPVRRLVEIVPATSTSPTVTAEVTAFAAEVLGRRVVRAPDRAGFIVNALLVPFLLSAVRMWEAGLATASDIDAAFVEGCGHPIGPLALVDLIGIDTTVAIAESMYDELRDPALAVPPAFGRMIDAHRLGRKTGRGFHEYREPAS